VRDPVQTTVGENSEGRRGTEGPGLDFGVRYNGQIVSSGIAEHGEEQPLAASEAVGRWRSLSESDGVSPRLC